MTLKEWMESTGATRQQLATKLGCSAEAVRRYEVGDRIPDRDTMPLLVAATGGQVTPNDFFGIAA